MPTIDLNSFSAELRESLSVDESYTDSIIPNAVRRYMKKLLRDYHFPKQIVAEDYTGIADGTQSYALPTDFKRAVAVYFYDDTDPDEIAYGRPLRRRETHILPHDDGEARFYWLTSTHLWTDIKVDAVENPNTNLALVYRSNSVDTHMSWLLNDFHDTLFTLSMLRLAAELNKPELVTIWAALWAEDQMALAKYANETEFENLDMVMAETSARRAERYPVNAT